MYNVGNDEHQQWENDPSHDWCQDPHQQGHDQGWYNQDWTQPEYEQGCQQPAASSQSPPPASTTPTGMAQSISGGHLHSNTLVNQPDWTTTSNRGMHHDRQWCSNPRLSTMVWNIISTPSDEATRQTHPEPEDTSHHSTNTHGHIRPKTSQWQQRHKDGEQPRIHRAHSQAPEESTLHYPSAMGVPSTQISLRITERPSSNNQERKRSS